MTWVLVNYYEMGDGSGGNDTKGRKKIVGFDWVGRE
jgi:hypothetical protein